MKISPFKLERFFALYEFKAPYLLSSSDCESLAMSELLEMANPESLALWQSLHLGYTESSGHPQLRSEIAGLYPAISADHILVAAPEEAIFIAMHALLSAGDHAIVLLPAYQSLHEIARSIGCRLTPWRLQPGANSWQLDLHQLEQAITPQTRLIVINFPHNPTGYLPTPAEFAAIVRLANQHGIYIFSDEMYRLLEYPPASPLPSIVDVYAKGIALSGLSKSFALPGLRIGWLTAQDQTWVERWLSLKDYTTICNSAPSEILAIIALQNRALILQRNLEIIQTNLTVARQFFHDHPDRFSWIEPQAGSVAFPQWLGSAPVEAFCQGVIDQQGVMLVPGSLFDYPGSHFRLGLGRKNFPTALQRLSRAL